MPRAYIEMILSSNPGNRRWYFAISCGSKRAWRSRGTSSSIWPVSPIARLFAGQVMIHLGVENPFGQRFLQVVDQAIGIEGSLGIGAGQQLIENGVRNTGFFASRHCRAPLLRSCPTSARNS